MGDFLSTTLDDFLNEKKQLKSKNNFDMFELLKKLPFFKYVGRPYGVFYHSIDIDLNDNSNISDLTKIVDKNNWYIESGYDKSFTITQKYIIDALVEIPEIIYHATPSKNIPSILKYGLKPKSENIKHKYPPRIYVSDNIQSLEPLIKELKKWKNNEEYSILKINTEGLEFDLYKDDTSAYKGHYYIQNINKIPSKNIELMN